MTEEEMVYNKLLDLDKSEEKEEIEIIDNSPVYVLVESIPDVLALNELNKKIEEKKESIKTKEDEYNSIDEKRKEQSDKIGIINDGNHINEIRVNLDLLRNIDVKRENKRSEIEEEYRLLKDLETDQKDLDATTRKMVDEMTNKYNSLKTKSSDLIEDYRRSANFKDFEEANRLLDEQSEYRKFESFNAILEDGEEISPDPNLAAIEEKNELPTETNKETDELVKEDKSEVEEKTEEKVEAPTKVKEEIKEEPKVEIDEEVNLDLPDLTNIKTDEIVEAVKEEVKPDVAPAVEPTKETVESPKEDVQETVAPEQREAPSFDSLFPTEEKVKVPVGEVDLPKILANRLDKIADSNKKGIESTISVFNPKKVESNDKTLTLE